MGLFDAAAFGYNMEETILSKGCETMHSSNDSDDRYTRGWNELVRITGEQGRERIEQLRHFAPDLCDMIIGFAYGDVYSRPGLTLQQRMIITITSLLTQGDTHQLKVHLQSGLRAGLTQQQLMELMLHCIPYIGFPRVMDGITILQEVMENN